ncbi:MAG: acyl-CoA thioesterase [Lewinellaceae bacterium]|nr:acyl-CoA thioesterase [Lewinellaceae bacterium]HRW76222.1 acyl-CoA thioesterase [Saprospiraceae bacterium]
MKSKKVSESKTTMTQMVMPNDTNPLGNLMGGNLLRWMDIAAGICAGKHSERYVVTASVDHVSFKLPIHMGEVVTMVASVTRAFSTSMEIYVEVFSTDIKGGNTRRCNHAYYTFVALDDERQKPVPVPEVQPLTSEEEYLYNEAMKRRELRLILSGRIKPQQAQELRNYINGIVD